MLTSRRRRKQLEFHDSCLSKEVLLDLIQKYVDPYRITKGKGFRLEDFDSRGPCGEQLDKGEATDLLQRGTAGLAEEQDMMHDTYKQDYLAQAERHIVIAEERIARQKKIIDELVQAGEETDCAVSMLHTLETCLHAFEQHRDMIFDRCKN